MNNGEPMEHTSDLILEFRGRDLEELFGNAAAGMLGTITPLDGVNPEVGECIRLEAPDTGELLVSWLNELLFYLDGRGLLLVEYEFESLDGGKLVAHARGEVVDLSTREVGPEIKAATYHALLLEKEDGGWRARVLFDL